MISALSNWHAHTNVSDVVGRRQRFARWIRHGIKAILDPMSTSCQTFGRNCTFMGNMPRLVRLHLDWDWELIETL